MSGAVFAMVNLLALSLVTDIPVPAAISTSSFILPDSVVPSNLILVVPDGTNKSYFVSLSSANITAFPELLTLRVLLAVKEEGVSVKPINVLLPEPVSVFVSVILPVVVSLAIDKPVLTARVTVSVVESDPFNCIFSSFALSPFAVTKS